MLLIYCCMNIVNVMITLISEDLMVFMIIASTCMTEQLAHERCIQYILILF